MYFSGAIGGVCSHEQVDKLSDRPHWSLVHCPDAGNVAGPHEPVAVRPEPRYDDDDDDDDCLQAGFGGDE